MLATSLLCTVLADTTTPPFCNVSTMSNDVSALSHRANLFIALSVVGVVTDIRPLPDLVTTVPRSWRRLTSFGTPEALAFPPISFAISP